MEKNEFYIKIVGWIFNPKERKLLVGKSPKEENYSFIEGDLAHEEEIDKCLKRTIAKSTGFKVHNLGAIYAENMLKDPKKVKIHFLCEATEGELKKGESFVEWIWVKPKEVEEKLGVKLPSRLHEYLHNLA